MSSKSILSLALVLAIALATSCQQKKYPYLIKIDLAKRTGCALHMSSDLASFERMDDVPYTLTDSQYVFKGTVTQPGVYTISCLCPGDSSISNISVFLPADSVQAIKMTQPILNPKFYHLYKKELGSHLRDTKVFSTSPKQRELEAYLQTNDSLWNKYFVDQTLVKAKFMQTLDTHNKVLIDQWADSANHHLERFPTYMSAAADVYARKHTHSEIALYAMLDDKHASRAVQARYRQYYQAMPSDLQQSFYGKLLKEHLAQGK